MKHIVFLIGIIYCLSILNSGVLVENTSQWNANSRMFDTIKDEVRKPKDTLYRPEPIPGPFVLEYPPCKPIPLPGAFGPKYPPCKPVPLPTPFDPKTGCDFLVRLFENFLKTLDVTKALIKIVTSKEIGAR